VAVGARVKAARIAAQMSQISLADQLGMTFQQIQKYEKGDNRISASRLIQIAHVLGLRPAVFLDGLEAAGALDTDFSLFAAPNVMELIVAYAALSPREQRAILKLAQELAPITSAAV
jgi:transcriptional regulator with XRE-family HTH domain